MANLVPVAAPPLSGGPTLTRLRGITAQPAVARTLPWLVGIAALGVAAIAYTSLVPAPQRTLYGELGDAERGAVAAALDKAAINYRIDPATGAVTVDADDLYKARMLVAADGAVAAPQTGAEMLDALPLGASRTMEGERLRAARERELELTIAEIDGVQGVRVHLAESEASVFVRETAPVTASVMIRLASGRQLGASQVRAVVNLVAASVPGLSADAVRVIDQHGRLLTDPRVSGEADRLDLQTRMEEKLRLQLDKLLTPMLGEGGFSSEIQVELDMDEVTSATESYGKDGVIRSETQSQMLNAGAGGALGVPGVLSNTPPPPTVAVPGAPQGPVQGAAPGAAPAANNTESSATRTYELGREVAVNTVRPGKLKRLSVAVAISSAVLKKNKTADIAQIRELVSAAVGADNARGDSVAVAVRDFSTATDEPPAFYEEPWFAMVLRNVVTLIAVLLVLLLAVRPLVGAMVRALTRRGEAGDGTGGSADGGEILPQLAAPTGAPGGDPSLLGQQIGLAQRMASDNPDAALAALRQMIAGESPAR